MELYRKDTRKSSFLLFLLGLGSATKVYLLGTIALSELVIFPLAPVLLLMNLQRLKQDGFTVFLNMLGLMTAGLFASSWWNHSPYPFVLKQFAVFYGFFAYYVAFYCLLRNNIKGLGWFFLGLFMSGVVTIWAFNPSANVDSSGFAFVADATVDDIIMGPLFWIGKVRGLGQLPIIAEYLKTPLAYSIITPILFVVFALFTTITGRGQSMCVLIGCAMMCIGRKSRASMAKIGKHFWTCLIVGAAVLFSYKIVYSYAAENGYLGEEALVKYKHQTDQGTGVLSMLMAGRTEFFIALTAIVDRPILGYGPRAEDTQGYAEKFLLKYGTTQDLASYFYYKMHYLSRGMVASIPTHSHIMSAWVWCGVPGLAFWVWVIYTIYRHIRFYSAAVPQWFGYFALMIPSILWGMFFNPVSSRFEMPLLLVCMAYARAIASGKLQLPYELEMEARKHE